MKHNSSVEDFHSIAEFFRKAEEQDKRFYAMLEKLLLEYQDLSTRVLSLEAKLNKMD